MGNAVYGYARVSSRDQNLDRQLDALAAFPVDGKNVFTDKASGRDFGRPGYRRLMEAMEPGDTLVVKSIDRLGRSYDEVTEEWRAITKRMGCSVVVLDMPLLDTRRDRGGVTGVFVADLVLQILSYVAQVERENIHQRQAEGIASAKARGVRFGRPPMERPECYAEVRRAFLEGELSRKEAASRLNTSVTTFSKWLGIDGRTAVTIGEQE